MRGPRHARRQRRAPRHHRRLRPGRLDHPGHHGRYDHPMEQHHRALHDEHLGRRQHLCRSRSPRPPQARPTFTGPQLNAMGNVVWPAALYVTVTPTGANTTSRSSSASATPVSTSAGAYLIGLTCARSPSTISGGGLDEQHRPDPDARGWPVRHHQRGQPPSRHRSARLLRPSRRRSWIPSGASSSPARPMTARTRQCHRAERDRRQIGEILPPAAIGVAQSALDYRTILSVQFPTGTAGAITIGTNNVGSTDWFVPNYHMAPFSMQFATEANGAVTWNWCRTTRISSIRRNRPTWPIRS